MVLIPNRNQMLPDGGRTESSVQNIETKSIQMLRQQQRLLPGLFSGMIASALGAVLWATISILTGYQIGWLVIGIGLLVGMTIQLSGKGVDRIFGWMGAVLVLLGCGIGNIFAVCGLASRAESIPLLSLCASMTPGLAFKLTQQTFKIFDLLFYVLAIYAGYRCSFRRHKPVTK